MAGTGERDVLQTVTEYFRNEFVHTFERVGFNAFRHVDEYRPLRMKIFLEHIERAAHEL